MSDQEILEKLRAWAETEKKMQVGENYGPELIAEVQARRGSAELVLKILDGRK